MTKIEEIEELRSEWQTRELKAEDKKHIKQAAEAHNIVYGLTLALRIIKRLPGAYK